MIDGIDPPSGKFPEIKYINYKESDKLNCIRCGKKSSLFLENTQTGEYEPLYICNSCMFIGTHYPIMHQIHLNHDDIKPKES